MPDPAIPPEPTPRPPGQTTTGQTTTGQTRADEPGTNTQHYRDVLCELVDIGLDLARMFHAHAKLQHQTVEAGAHPHAPIDFSIPYENLARTIRRSIVLARRLDQPPPPAKAATEQSRIAARRKIIREVEDAIERQPAQTPPETLREELRTRLDAPDLEEDIDNRPIDDIIAEICHDFGLDHAPGSPPWKRRTPEDIAHIYNLAIEPPKAARHLRRYTSSDPPAANDRRKRFFFEKKNQKTSVTEDQPGSAPR